MYLRPHGRKTQTLIDRPPEIERMAGAFMMAGGYFEVEELSTGLVSLTAGHPDEDDEGDIAIEVVTNGPAVLDAVDRLVAKAYAWLQQEEGGGLPS
jgi:hypothetical protein